MSNNKTQKKTFIKAAIYLKPKTRLLATRRFTSKYHNFCRDEYDTGDLFFDVKKLMTRGELIPVDFGSKVNLISIGEFVSARFYSIVLDPFFLMTILSEFILENGL